MFLWVDAEFWLIVSKSMWMILIHIKLFQLVQELRIFLDFLRHNLSEFIIKFNLFIEVSFSIFSFLFDKSWLIFCHLSTKSWKLFNINFFISNNIIFSINQESFKSSNKFFNWSFSDIESHTSRQKVISYEKEQEHKVLNNFCNRVF